MNKALRKIVGNKRVVAVIPAYNEEKHIGDVVRETKKFVDEVIVVDDSSKDNTEKFAMGAGAVVLRHVINLQKGGALKTGCEAAITLGADIIITLDGDGQHDPNEIFSLLRKLKKYDLVIGARKFNKNMPLNSRVGNRFLTWLSQLLFRNKITDSQTGYRAFNANIYPKITWESTDYGIETEMIKNISKHNISHAEVEVKTIYNDNYKGTTPFDGLKILANMISWRVKG